MARTLSETITDQVGERVVGDTHPEISYASVRAPIEGEIRVLAVTTLSVLHFVPDGNASNYGTPRWNGRMVRMLAEGGEVYIAFSSDGACAIDETSFSVQTGSTTVGNVTATRVTANASNEECWRIPQDTWMDIPVPADAIVFALKGSASCTLRTHPSET